MKLIAAICVMLASACASTSSSSGLAGSGGDRAGDTNSCAPLAAAMVYRGTTLYSNPDSTSAAVTNLDTDTRLCASSSTAGFGFRRVRLPDGRDAYAPADHVSDL